MHKKYITALLVIIALGAFFRFYRINETPPGLYPDEAMNGSNAQEALATRNFKVFYPENNGREGLFINLQAISVATFGAKPWALRIVSAIIGTLTILGMYLVTKELFTSPPKLNAESRMLKAEFVALFSSFFLATNYWHLNFSRIGFRAIMLPLMATFGMYFLLKGLRKGKPLDLIAAGLFTGLGLYTYIAFRFMVFVFAVPVVWSFWRWMKTPRDELKSKTLASYTPYALVLYIGVAFVTILPIGLYFLNHPQDFVNRAGDVSIFSAASPLKEFVKSVGLTLQMFFYQGDGNWRHNLAYAPELHPFVALFLIIGILILIRKVKSFKFQATTLCVWFFTMLLPVALTREGVPHALRSIGMIPPVMILGAVGADQIQKVINRWIAKEKITFPQKVRQLERIRRELIVLLLLSLLVIPIATWRSYFLVWANRPQTYDAFDTSHLHLGEYLASLPTDVHKYVIVNTRDVIVRGIPMPAQTIMFATNTFTNEKRPTKNFAYLLRGDIDKIIVPVDKRTIITLLDETDRPLISALQKKFPFMQPSAPGDFMVLKNF